MNCKTFVKLSKLCFKKEIFKSMESDQSYYSAHLNLYFLSRRHSTGHSGLSVKSNKGINQNPRPALLSNQKVMKISAEQDGWNEGARSVTENLEKLPLRTNRAAHGGTIRSGWWRTQQTAPVPRPQVLTKNGDNDITQTLNHVRLGGFRVWSWTSCTRYKLMDNYNKASIITCRRPPQFPGAWAKEENV